MPTRSSSAKPHDYPRFAMVCCALSAMGLACHGYSPPLFAARAALKDARDEGSVPVPRTRSVPEPVYLSEVYLHHPLRDALYLSSYPEARDINSFDEVPRSSWFTPRELDVGAMARGPEVAGDTPLPPFTVLPDPPVALASAGFCIRDSRGKFYEIAVDPEDRPEMRTGALAVAARIVWALGLNTPPVAITRARFTDFWFGEGKSDALKTLQTAPVPKDGYYRVAAVSWPDGQYLGPSPEVGLRVDDRNDVIDHEDRRTLRALAVFASWLALSRLGPAKTIDRYVGAPGEGFVVHYFTGLDAALAASNVVRVTDPPSDLPGGGSPFIRFFTLGLLRNHSPPLTQLDIPAIGDLSEHADPRHFDIPLPYAPADRLLPSDGYWASKRIAELSPTHLALAIDAGKYSDSRVPPLIQHALEERARDVVAYWFSRVVPLELVSLEGTRLVLRDMAAAHDLVALDVTDYRADFLGREGEVVAEPIIAHPTTAELTFDLPPAAARAAENYLIVQITARRRRHWLPRAVELHIRPMGQGLAVVGVRH